MVALGANRPGRHASVEAGLEAALARFSAVGLTVVKRSGWWRSAAWPDATDPPFLNGVAIVQTPLAPEAVMEVLHALEAEAGRTRGAPNAPRPLDLDLIAHGRRLQEGPPRLPHPRAHNRRFVMGPLAQIAPDWRHPSSGRAALDLAAAASVGADARPL